MMSHRPFLAPTIRRRVCACIGVPPLHGVPSPSVSVVPLCVVGRTHSLGSVTDSRQQAHYCHKRKRGGSLKGLNSPKSVSGLLPHENF